MMTAARDHMAASDYDAVVVGAGPNGLSAANYLADAGLSVLVVEAKSTIGGGARSAELTLPGYLHDICSAIHPFGAASPWFRRMELERYGLSWVHPEHALAHPFDDGDAAVLDRSLDVTCASLGGDGPRYRALMARFLPDAEQLFDEVLRPIRFPKRPFLLARFGLTAVQSCQGLVHRVFRERAARALFTGSAAHAIRSLDSFGTAAFGLMLSLSAHYVGWPAARGGSRTIVEAMARRLTERGGRIETDRPVSRLADLPPSRAVLFDLTPRQVEAIAGAALPERFRSRLRRYHYGPGIFKIDWALSGPIPWRAAACHRAGTVHLGGTFDELARAEHEVENGVLPASPFVLVTQQSGFDSTRAPSGKQTGWAYCHVPHGSVADMTAVIEGQIERFAPGFRDLILERRTINTAELEAHNANMIGGDIGGGANNLLQFLFRPLIKYDPYATPNRRLYLCSSSTPPGGGVHGLCGYWAARSALRRAFGKAPGP
jgi:phytoene dehydrogenase-like protein